ncbi:MAG: [protein-PII] uridylyltransferase [Pirellulales bacterium]|nr:[protein-PII] uridylyltransferase [Pirellulales bacterium]
MNHISPKISAAKQHLASGYEVLKKRHAEGASGVDLSREMSDLRDEVILDLIGHAITELFDDPQEILPHIAVVAHGGYGRRELAPFSDVDIMLLHSPDTAQRVEPLAQRIVCDVFDSGLKLGHSVRTPRQAMRLAAGDTAILTSLIESRLLMGENSLLEEFNAQLDRYAKQHARTAITAVDQARSRERSDYGDTVFLLEPNVKRSPGTARDLQLIRWIGFLRYGTREPDELLAADALSPEDHDTIIAAHEFLLHLRNDMHFHCGSANDVLSREEQLRIAPEVLETPKQNHKSASKDGQQAPGGMLPVERFMREYFRHTAGVAHVAKRFLTKAQSRDRIASLASAVFGHRVEGGLRVGISGLTVDRRGLLLLKDNLTEMMRLVALSNLYDKPIAPATWEAVRRNAPKLPDELPTSACLRFLSLLEHPARLGQILRDLHEIGVLERFIPEFAHARGLLQFNAYHKFTVDEHCLRAVEFAARLAADDGPLGQTYSRIKQKNILHLAILIHDLGKGFDEDHRELAKQIARKTSKRLGIKPRDAQTLEFLAANHDMMNHTAFRRDCHDEQLLVDFASKVGSIELLRMLYILTAADMSAVGPGVWDGWKNEILLDLFQGAALYLADEASMPLMTDMLARRRDEVRRALGDKAQKPWFDRQLGNLPTDYINATDPQYVADDLMLLGNLDPGQTAARAEFVSDSQTVQITVGINGTHSEGAFHKLTGVLTGLGLTIRSAHIHSLANNLALDRFCTHDGDYADRPPADRLREIECSLIEAIEAKLFVPKPFRQTRIAYGPATAQNHPAQHTSPSRLQVRFDNTTSTEHTILDVFALDRPGLLFEMARALFQMDLSVARAKIATHLDQVVDVFYVTNAKGEKLTDETRLEAIRNRLLEIGSAENS